MQNFLTYLRIKYFLYIVLVVVVLGGIVLLTRNNGENVELVTVARGPFIQQVSISGKIVTAQDTELGFSQIGRVASVYTRVGDKVVAGTALASLENDDLRANVLQRKAALAKQEAKLAALRQGTRPEELALAETMVANDTIALAQAERALFNRVRDAYRSADDAISNQLDQIFHNPHSSDPQIKFLSLDTQFEMSLERGRVMVGTLLASWKTEIGVPTHGTELLASVERAQKNLDQVTNLLVKANTVLNRTIATEATPQSTINAYVTAVGNARTAVNVSISTLTNAVTARTNAMAALATSQRNLALRRAGPIASDIDAQVAAVKAAEAELAKARAQFDRTIMRAPFTGVVAKMDLKIGSIASANVSEVSLISDAFQIESYISELNIARIALGDSATVTFDAYGDDLVFDAKIVSIDPAETVRDGVSAYRTVLKFTAYDERIMSGMTANVLVTTDSRENVVVVPRGVVVNREGKKFVSVAVGEGITEREITTGAVSSLGTIEVLSGLSEGELVVVP